MVKKYNIDDIVYGSVRYGDDTDKVFRFLEEAQLKDKELWETLVLQFIKKADSADCGWRGEFWGKLMRGACLVYSYTKDAELYDILSKTVKDLLAVQDEFGRISTYKVENEFSGWDVWCRKYVMLGLCYFLEICKEENIRTDIINSLKTQLNYFIEHVGKGKKEFYETSDIWGCINSYSILQPIVKIYKLTKEKRYLEYAYELIESQDVRGMNFHKVSLENKLAPFEYSVNKAYETISFFEGLVEFYEVTGEEEYMVSAENFADKMLKTDFTIVGGSGCYGEQFNNATKSQVVYSTKEMQETCVTVTVMKFLTQLFLHTGKTSYFDAVERCYYNLYSSTINYDYNINVLPVFLSYSPILHNVRWLLQGGKKDIAPERFYGCCLSIGSAGIGMLPKGGMFIKDDIIYLNYLSDAEYTVGEDIKFMVTGGYPNAGDLKIKFEKTPIRPIKLKIRKPAWCENFSITGKNLCFEEIDGYILTEIKDVCEIVYSMDMPIKYIVSSTVNEDIDYRVALMRGPLVLSKDDLRSDDIIDFDFNCNYAEETVKEGVNNYTITLKNGSKFDLKKYSDCGKKNFNFDCVDVWFKFK